MDIATSDVIMLEIIIYCVASVLILYFMDWIAAKKIGDKRRPGYRLLRPYKTISLMVIALFTCVIGFLCLFRDLSVTRYTLTYFGLPYFLALVYYMVKMMRRVRAETKGRR